MQDHPMPHAEHLLSRCSQRIYPVATRTCRPPCAKSMMNLPRLITSSSLLAISFLSIPALAAGPDDAAVLFDRGVADLEAGRYDAACPAIEQSYKLDPRPGTLFALAECEMKRGHLGAAAARYDQYLALYPTLSADKRAKQGDREKMA